MMLALVSTMTEREFGMVFSKLAIQLQCMNADVVTIKSYFEALKDFALEVIQASAAEFAREPGRKFFPTTPEWADRARALTTAALREAVRPAREDPWRFDCTGCEDTGWCQHECDGSDQCGRSKTHAPHSYVTACPCRPTNRTLARHQRFGSGA